MGRRVKSKNHITYDCHYHVVWVTKYRLPLLVDGADEELKSIIYRVAEEHDAHIESIEVMPDHVHVVVESYPHTIRDVVRKFKGRSSRELRERFSHIKRRTPSLWTRSYFIATTGGAPLKAIKKYVESQKLRKS